MASISNLVYDGYSALVGCDGSRRPLKTPRELVHRAFNCTFRGDQMGPRPGFRYQPVTFDSELTANNYHGGRFQGAIVYTPEKGSPHMIVVKGGRVFRIKPNAWTIEDVTIRELVYLDADFSAPPVDADNTATLTTTSNLRPGMRVAIGDGNYTVKEVVNGTDVTLTNVDDTPGDFYPTGTALIYYDVNPGKFYQCWMLQAEKWLLIQDGESRCIIYDGISCRRADNTEILIGRSMAYGNGRIWLEMPDGKSFTAGDLLYGSSGTAAEGYRDSILKWTENVFLAEGGAFRIPTGAGPIRGMRFISNLDTSLGQGPLQVFTTNGSFSVAAPLKRSDWLAFNADNSPIQTVSLTGGGAESERSLVQINADIMFRSRKGIRSFQIGRQLHTRWVNTPMSKQVGWVINSDQPALLQYASAVEFDQRYICTCAPQLSGRGVVHRGFVAMDFDQVTWLDDTVPQWDGLWTAINTYQILTGIFDGDQKCYAFSENNNGEMELYELTRDAHFDQANVTEKTKIRWGGEFSSLSFPTESSAGPFDLKSLEGGEVFVADAEGEVTFKVRFRPDGYPCWVPWHWWKVCSTQGACSHDAYSPCPDWSMGKPTPYGPMGLGRPPDLCDEANGRTLRNLYSAQLRLDVRGYAILSSIRLAALPIPQPPVSPPKQCDLHDDL